MFSYLYHFLRELTNSVYVGESVICSHISNVKVKLVAKVPHIIFAKITRI